MNLVALVIAFIGAISEGESPLQPVQLLWVNLIMDTMGNECPTHFGATDCSLLIAHHCLLLDLAALALATEPPSRTLLERPPHGRFSNIITNRMWRLIAGEGIFQIFVLLFTLYGNSIISFLNVDTVTHNTIVFNAFVFCQIFNEINCRKLNDGKYT